MKFGTYGFHSEKIRFLLGDVRDKERLSMALDGVDYVIHAAALKKVHWCEYNPTEPVKTNIFGAMNVVQRSIENGVKKVIALSTDKAVEPLNLYGKTKAVADNIFIGGNALSREGETIFSLVRYGNVAGSRGSVIPYFRSLKENTLPVTDERMTRFWITLDEATDLVINAFDRMQGGEVYVSQMPSFRVVDLVRAMDKTYKVVGMRPGEKIHEVCISEYDITYQLSDYYVIYPQYQWRIYDYIGERLDGFRYSSDKNKWWLEVKEIKERLKNV
jgi:UDP-N-acetylglucosamine 4,6-dehydratase